MDSSNNPQPENQGRRRARKSDGQFKGDNPVTPGLNEAWEPVEVAPTLEKTVDYSVKQQINSTSESTAGKYSKQEKIRPTFGKVTTTFN